jgi:GTP pyrophosphokinase
LYNIKKQKLEDLGIKIHWTGYNDIIGKIKETKRRARWLYNPFLEVLKKSLGWRGVEFIIKGRPKSIYLIGENVRSKKRSRKSNDKFVYELSIRPINTMKILSAWKICSIVTDHYRPSPSRLRDRFRPPKSTGYEAPNTVMGPKGRWAEVQVRSERMMKCWKGYMHKYKNGGNWKVVLRLGLIY